jgi:hypothetical protein
MIHTGTDVVPHHDVCLPRLGVHDFTSAALLNFGRLIVTLFFIVYLWMFYLKVKKQVYLLVAIFSYNKIQRVIVAMQ